MFVHICSVLSVFIHKLAYIFPIANFRTKQFIPPYSGEQFANWNFEVTAFVIIMY